MALRCSSSVRRSLLSQLVPLVAEHAALDAAQAANRPTEELKAIGSPFLSSPRISGFQLSFNMGWPDAYD